MPDTASTSGPADSLADVDARIVSAWAALAGARAAASHSPNGRTVALEEMCERTVNELLERRHELVEAERIVRA